MLPGLTRAAALPALKVPLLTAAAYLLAGLAALQLAIPPSYASPLYPPAGIALACALVYGWRALPGIALGSFGVNVLTASWRGELGAATLLIPAVAAAGAALQAGLGARLVQRVVPQPLTLAEPRDIALFFGAGAAVGCLVNASLTSSVMRAAGTITVPQWPLTWLTWWTGDALGVLIAAPLVLTLIGQPRDEWAPRRVPLGLTLLATTLLVAGGIHQVVRWEQARVRATFERDASGLSTTLATQLQEPLHALAALHGVFVSSDDVSRSDMRRASAGWLASGRLQALGWSERLRREQIPAFEARGRAEGGAARVFDRLDAGIERIDAAEDVVAMRFIEPMSGNAGALGVNVLSVAAARRAVEAAARTDRPIASAGFRLTQQAPGEDATGVVVYRALYRGNPATPEERRAALRGVAFVTLRMDSTVDVLHGPIPPYLRFCVIDLDPQATRRRLTGDVGCETAAPDLLHSRTLDYADRRWELRVYAEPGAAPDSDGTNAWLFSLIGLLAAAMLGALLLTVTGRTRRIEAAVRQRTAALEDEVRERERAEAEMRESEQRFRNIFENVPIGVIYADLQGNVKRANPRFCELIGHDEATLRKTRWLDHTCAEDVTQDLELTDQLVRGEIPMYRRHKRFVTHDGGTVWVQATVSLLRDGAGQPHRIVAVIEDITEHLRLQEAEKARELAEAANRAKSEFLSRMSHELRTPLNAMLGFAQLLELDRQHPLAAAQQPWVAQIQSAGWHLLEMINDVLDLSRIESDTLELDVGPLDLAELLAATLPLVNAEAQRRGVRISADLAPDGVDPIGNATRVKQILTNLLSNAVKYNHDGGHVHVQARPAGEAAVEISVTDTGLGMTPQQVADLFQPFNRLGRERSSREGTGIGLVISRRLAELMGGTLRARSVAGEGSCFILTLPRATGADTVRSELDPLAPAEPAYHRRIVHYVEDNETNVEVMRGILAQRPQVCMDVSITGLDALAAIRARRPDLVLLDMHLPDINGLELLRHLKADGDTAAIPVVAVSADATLTQIEGALAAGAARYLTKPVNVAELLAAVDEVLERSVTRFG